MGEKMETIISEKSVIISFDWDYAFFYPDISGHWKAAYREAMDWLLAYLDEKKLTATMFITPEDARMFPDYVREIVRRHHPVGLHIHSVFADTPYSKKVEIHQEGKELLEDVAGSKIQMYRGGMFYMDRDIVEILDNSSFIIDSSLVPGRVVVDKWRAGENETRYMEFNVPMDYRGYPSVPYFLIDRLLEIPPSRYCMDFMTGSQMLAACQNEKTNLSVIYCHPKNLGDHRLRESINGRFRESFLGVMDGLLEGGFQFIGYDKVYSLMMRNPFYFNPFEKGTL